MVGEAKLRIPAARQYSRFPLSLHNGDTLSSAEFLRRYGTMPEVKKAELIEGKVYMGSPVSVEHAEPDGFVQGWLAMYAMSTPGVIHLPNTTVVLDDDNTLQPDGLLRFRSPKGRGKYLVGPPELIVEVAASSASIDMREKLDACERNRVPEYLVWLVREGAFKWHVLREGKYVEQFPAKGLLKSVIFPGLILDVKALLSLDGKAVLAALQRGMNSPEHEEFARQLAHRSA
jgi:Uma2 family endonuclease